jgi:hypothetical protein
MLATWEVKVADLQFLANPGKKYKTLSEKTNKQTNKNTSKQKGWGHGSGGTVLASQA